VRPPEILGTAQTPDGGRVSLVRDPSGLTIRLDGLTLMAEKAHGSERAMARVACAGLSSPAPRVLVGGLGLGYTLRAALDALPPTAEVVCAELLGSIVEWHRGPLGPLASHPIEDARVRLQVGDIVALFQARGPDAPPEWDAILLDVDNGPIPLTVVSNWWLYAAEGLEALARSLRPGGTLVVWSAGDDDRFARRMRRAGLDAWIERVTARTGRRGRRGGETHVLFVGRRE
jgi:spermidine synthase